MLSYIKRTIIKLCESGVPDNCELEIRRKIFIINLFSLVGVGITFSLAINAAVTRNYPLLPGLLFACIGFYTGYYYLKCTGRYTLPAKALLYILSGLMLYLIYSGGVNNTGPLWIYVIPAVALFLGGLVAGLINIFLFILCCSILMFYNGGELLATSYTQAFKLRLLFSFLTVTFLSCCYEYSRRLSYQNIKDLSNEFEKMAKIDPLTGLSNRRDMLDIIQAEYARINRSQHNAAVLLCDIDFFKSVNDTLGHDAGDIVLKELSKLFKQNIRKNDSVARWGGEEFLFLLPDTHLKDAYLAAENIREKVEQHTFNVTEQNKKIRISISIGIAKLAENKTITETIARADKFLYQAKLNGRNQVCAQIMVPVTDNKTQNEATITNLT